MFNFYITKDWKDNYMNKIHFYCLKYYSHIFTEIIFMVSIDDLDDKETLFDFEEYILSLRLCPSIHFMIKPNHIFREGKNFYDEIATKLDKLDGLTFFAHNKGITNYTDSRYYKEDVKRWVTSMYFGCLDNMDEAIFVMTEDRCVSYGTLFDILTIGEDEDKTFYENGHIWFGKHKYFYMGTFFWLNAFALVSYMKNSDTSIPILSDRWYAENFLSNIIDYGFCGTYDYRTTFNHTGFGVKDIEHLINFSFGDKVDKYNDFHNNVLSNIE